MHERKRQQFEELLKLISDNNAETHDTTEVDKNS